MIAGLEKINSFAGDAIHEPVLLRDTAGPATLEEIFQRLGFARALEWITHYCFDEIQYSQRGAPVELYPES
ncbi:MAG TPA: hypothetical protein VG672_02680 [Bryobacteraceae bacterium]|nr:hypothetical protein [Bryobacteraceae bacterium]